MIPNLSSGPPTQTGSSRCPAWETSVRVAPLATLLFHSHSTVADPMSGAHRKEPPWEGQLSSRQIEVGSGA